MIARQLARLEETETTGVLRWRFTELVRAGYPSEDALELATHSHVDLHTAADLVRRGCPPDTAKRILL
jgi:hypothetical protein